MQGISRQSGSDSFTAKLFGQWSGSLRKHQSENSQTPLYSVRRVSIGKTEQLDTLAHACGELYSQTVVSFWRMVRKHGLWLKPKHLMRWHTSPLLHAHTSDACVQAFFAALDSWRERRRSDPKARPHRKRKWYFRIEYKSAAIHYKDGVVTLSNGWGNVPLMLEWPWPTPKTVVIRWADIPYEAIATYAQAAPDCHPSGTEVAGIDLGEIPPAVAHDGQQTFIADGRLLRAKRRYQNMFKGKLSARLDHKQKGSSRRKRLMRSKHKQLKHLQNQIKDMLHKQTSRLITTLHQRGVQTLVIGDVRNIRQDNDKGAAANQKIHQWSAGKTCPLCGKRRKIAPNGRIFTCTNQRCQWQYHRDGAGAIGIRAKYRGEFGRPRVVGVMAPPTGLRYLPHVRCSSLLLDGCQHMRQREAAAL
jgi:putative transposase